MLCKPCLEKGEALCPSCGRPMPAGRGKVDCETCYWEKLFRKRLDIDRAAFSSPGMEEVFGEFGEWLFNEVGAQKAALSIHRYLPFFMEIENRWRAVPAYDGLLAHFGAEALRRVRLPMRWLEKAKAIVPDAVAKNEDSDRRRIREIIDSIPDGTPAGTALRSYNDMLMVRVEAGKTKIGSVRLALRPAASLLSRTDPSGKKLPDKAALDGYLLEAPGQKAAITGFINFLNEKHGLGLIPEVSRQRVAEARKKKLEKELLALARQGGEGEEFKHAWLSTALAFFHGLSRNVGKKLDDSQIAIEEDGGFEITWDGQNYWIPKWDRNR
ncbi:hypothetical protein [Methylomagnum ishizawai]|nr:hypothetical protein [Methylomagnum ishizawai]